MNECVLESYLNYPPGSSAKVKKMFFSLAFQIGAMIIASVISVGMFMAGVMSAANGDILIGLGFTLVVNTIVSVIGGMVFYFMSVIASFIINTIKYK